MIFRAAILASSLVLTALHSAPLQAQSQDVDIRGDAKQLTGTALLSAYRGVTHKGTYAFTRDGTGTAHYTETTHADGRVEYKEGDLIAHGAWVPSHDSLCFHYKSDDMGGGCFHVWQIGNCYYYYATYLHSFGSGNTLESPDTFWTARSVKSGDTPDCDPDIG